MIEKEVDSAKEQKANFEKQISDIKRQVEQKEGQLASDKKDHQQLDQKLKAEIDELHKQGESYEQKLHQLEADSQKKLLATQNFLATERNRITEKIQLETAQAMTAEEKKLADSHILAQKSLTD